MKTNLVIALVLLLGLLLVSCAPVTEPCPPHLDEDMDSVCDKCEEEFVPDDAKAALEAIDLSSVRFDGKTVTYNGETHSLEIKGTLPSGVSVQYEGNGQSTAGSYSVVAKFYYHSDTYNKDYYIEGEDMTAPLRIKKASFDVSHIFFGSASVVENGEGHSLAIEGTLPDGVSVAYEGNGKSAVGEYTVTAVFVVDETNYEVPAPLVAKLKIVEGPMALGGIMLKDAVVAFDGEAHSLSLISDGVDLSAATVTSVGNNVPYIGENIVRFTITIGGESALLEARLTIEAGELVGTNGLVYKNNNGNLEVVGYTGTDKVVVIPGEYTMGGTAYSVTGIAGGAFAGNTEIEYVVLSDNILAVGNNAFQGCTALKRVKFSNYMTAIGGLAFAECALDEVVLPDTLLAIGKSAFRDTPVVKMTLPFIGGSRNSSSDYLGYLFGADGYAGNAAYVPETLTTIILSDACTEIPAYALRGCFGITEIVLGKSVTKIGISAFEGTSIEEIYIPASVVRIPAAAYVYNSPFYNTSDSLVIRLEASSLPDGYGAMWCVVNSDGDTATVEYGAGN